MHQNSSLNSGLKWFSLQWATHNWKPMGYLNRVRIRSVVNSKNTQEISLRTLISYYYFHEVHLGVFCSCVRTEGPTLKACSAKNRIILPGSQKTSTLLTWQPLKNRDKYYLKQSLQLHTIVFLKYIFFNYYISWITEHHLIPSTVVSIVWWLYNKNFPWQT